MLNTCKYVEYIEYLEYMKYYKMAVLKHTIRVEYFRVM